MSKWVRGIYNTAANFVLSGSLRAASGRTMDRDTEQLRKECDKSNEHGKSGEPCKSGITTADSSCTATCSCTGTSSRDSCGTTCSCTAATGCSTCSTAKDGKLPNKHGDSCTCSLCRDYSDYISSTGSGTIRSEGQGAGSRIRFSHEPRDNKQSTSISTDPVEHITGIQSGVTV